MATLSATQKKQVEAFHTPSANSPLWFDDPQGEDKGDKKTPHRNRYVHGDHLILVEAINYWAFPSPEVVAAMKAKGKKAFPIKVEQYYVHLLNTKYMYSKTFKVYLHQSKMLYADSSDFATPTAKKSGPEKTRAHVVAELARTLKVDAGEASNLLAMWAYAN